MKRFFTAALFFVGLIVIWHFGREFMVSTKRWSPVLVPSPAQVAQFLVNSSGITEFLEKRESPWLKGIPATFGLVSDGSVDGVLFPAIWVTMKRLLLGYAIGVVVGVPLGLLTARFKWASDTIGVVGLGLQTLPSVCWVPLAILWFHQTEAAMQFVVIMGTLWSVQISTDNGVRNVPPIYQRAAQTMGSRGLHTWIMVNLPASLPFIVSGVKQGWAFAWRSLMAAEIYVTILTGSGLGILLHYGRENLDMSQVIGIMLVIIFIGLLADKILFSPWERFLHRRWGTVKA